MSAYMKIVTNVKALMEQYFVKQKQQRLRIRRFGDSDQLELLLRIMDIIDIVLPVDFSEEARSSATDGEGDAICFKCPQEKITKLLAKLLELAQRMNYSQRDDLNTVRLKDVERRMWRILRDHLYDLMAKEERAAEVDGLAPRGWQK